MCRHELEQRANLTVLVDTLQGMSQSFDELVRMFRQRIVEASQRRRLMIADAAREEKRFLAKSYHEPMDAALASLEAEASSIETVPGVISSQLARGRWYYGPLGDGEWTRYRANWVASGKPGVDYLDESTERIVGMLANPAAPEDKRKGLVMGNVQSGKTGNFAGVIAKAADAGYSMVIVLSGMHNNLRRQTQQRLDRDVFDPNRWHHLTGEDHDCEANQGIAAALNSGTKICAVVKKNKTRLQNLITLLKAVPIETRRKRPVLIIDDEADQATPNSAAERDRISGINSQLRELWDVIPSGSYVAYTATPFANILMDPDDLKELFPSDFITTLEPGSTYFGAQRVFGLSDADPKNALLKDGLDMVRLVSDDEAKLLRPRGNRDLRAEWTCVIPQSLEDALIWFLLATAARRIRGNTKHSSMLVHTTHYADPHFKMQDAIERWLDASAASLPIERMRKLWDEECDKVAQERSLPLPSWPELLAALPGVFQDTRVLVDNGESDERLDYSSGEPQTVIAIGGGTLSRGLTLEDLVVSYFTRTTSAYDTLMQMGRWFGYRDGYEDLARIWVTKGLKKDYAFLARVEQDLRDEIKSLEGSEYTPEQVGVRIRKHPGRLEITSAGKMTHSKTVQLSLSGSVRQTFILDAGDPDGLQGNWSAADKLLGHVEPIPWGGGQRYWRQGASNEEVLEFINSFHAHPELKSLQSDEQLELISKWVNESASGCSWNIVLMGNSRPGAASELGVRVVAGVEVPMVGRAPLKEDSSLDRLNFKAITSPEDTVCDIDRSVMEEKPTSADKRKRARRIHAPEVGLVVLYPISGRSTPDTEMRMEFPEPIDVLGYAIVFPSVQDIDGREGEFVSVRATPEVQGDYEESDDADMSQGRDEE